MEAPCPLLIVPGHSCTGQPCTLGSNFFVVQAPGGPRLVSIWMREGRHREALK